MQIQITHNGTKYSTTMLHTKRLHARRKEIETALTSDILNAIWMKDVRQSLRQQALIDLHDHYDFHLLRKSKIKTLISKVLDGSYQPRRALRVRQEKSKGIARQIVILAPEDALILEALGQFLYDFAEKNQVSKNAFFSRKHGKRRDITSLNENAPYQWWELWPHFQQAIYEFAHTKAYLVVTDIANYYDNISFDTLRRSIASMSHFSEGFLDFLFYTIERFAWRPDYLPHPGQGLPQVNLEALRVLAHTFLFDIDEFLERATNKHYVRWMDDIDFGVDSLQDAENILRDLDELLLSKGLHLNSSKTKILEFSTANAHFNINENRYLTVLNNRITRIAQTSAYLSPEIKRARKRFLAFVNRPKTKTADKIYKRYLTIFSDAKDNFLSNYFPLASNPQLRSKIFSYYLALGWSQARENELVTYYFNATDDESKLRIAPLLCTWIPASYIQYIQRMRALRDRLFHSKSPTDTIVCLWLHIKFSNKNDLSKFVITKATAWKNSDWIARQFAASWPLLNPAGKTAFENLITAHGLTSARDVIKNYQYLSSGSRKLSQQIIPYLKATSKNGTYPLYKFLILKSFIDGAASHIDKDRLIAKFPLILKDIRYNQLIRRP